MIPSNGLTQKHLIAVHLIGRYFAYELEIAESDIVTADELSVFVKADKKTVTARLHDLKKENVIESPGRGEFRISVSGADKILDEILSQ